MESQEAYMKIVHSLTLPQLRSLSIELKLSAAGRKKDILNRLQTYMMHRRDTALEVLNSITRARDKPQPSVPIPCTYCKVDMSQFMKAAKVKMLHLACAHCQMTKYSHLEVVEDTMVEPFLLVNDHQKSMVSFSVTDELLDQVRQAKGALQVQLRSIKLDGKGFLPCWPRSASVIFDRKLVMELVPRKPNEKARKDNSLNITSLLTRGPHSFGIIYEAEAAKYVAGLYLIKKLTDEEVKMQVEGRSMPAEPCERSFQQLMSSNSNGVTTELVSLPLTCPISKALIKNPVRGHLCLHSACFDLDSWLFMQRSTTANRFKCPICNSPAVDLRTDKFISRVLEDAARYTKPICAKLSGDLQYQIIEFEQYYDEIDRAKRKSESEETVRTLQLIHGKQPRTADCGVGAELPAKRRKFGSEDHPIDID
jgi:hypothetical protein